MAAARVDGALVARRCIDLAKRLRLPTLHGVATVHLAIGAAHDGDRERMKLLVAEADTISDGHPDVIALGGVAGATYWIDRDDLRQARSALAQMMEKLRVTPALACPERGIWALFQALDGDEVGKAAIDELDAYVGPNHVMIDSYRSYAQAVVFGRLGALGVSAREAEVLELLADARSTRSIAENLHASPKTVERHIANLATKLGLEGRTAVVAFAARSAPEPVD